ncbi:37 kDa salivary gland allergen Aed a 2 [Culex quinquefasciatus]|uniref:37 kDa salivary gland allergen Aed a 2 n=1 Tax=Culex quinquefasciatus TaxID=7176 RepID=UPI0018E33AE5|nr:37 kDa salivary gland allergen Aed a 2 [Culex quinquefasciatus]
MNFIGIFGLIIVACFTGACSAWKPLSPEETLFTYTRCMEDIAAGDLELAKKWMIWQVEEDPKTACYVKCVVVGLGLFDNSSKTFKGDHILEQYEKYKQYTSQDEAGVKEFQKAVQDLKIVRSSNCLTLFKRYLPVHAKFTDVEQNVFFGKKEITDKIYSSDDTIKKQDETIFRFCERHNFKNDSPELCNMRKTGLTTNNKHLDCLFRGLRYFDRDGNINPAEVKRDFHMINVADKDAAVDNALNNCKVKEATKATDYNDCLWKDPNLKDLMMPVFDYREVRSESYLHYILNPEPYDVAKVKEKVKKYDKDAGC